MGFESLAVHGDASVADPSSVAPPLYLTSAFKAGDAEEFETMATQMRHDRFYTRYGNPTRTQAQLAVAALESAQAALLFASGMAASTAAILTCAHHGDHVVAQRQLYAGVATFTASLKEWFGIDVTFVDQTDAAAFAAAVTDRTTLFVLESPSNPTLEITDVRAVVATARACGALTLIDNTLASPINQRPLEFGIDLVMHSATKYLNGHSDTIAGAIAGSNELIDRIWQTSVSLGSALAPFDAWLVLRGIRTLPLRMRAHNANAQAVAELLERHPSVERVFYPGLASHPQHALACAQMTGFGGLLSMRFAGGAPAAERFIAALKLPVRAASLGGVESLVSHPASMWAHLDAAELTARGVDPGLVRLACGIETTADLVADVEQALAALPVAGP